MKKITIFLLILFFISLLCSTTCFAYETSEIISDTENELFGIFDSRTLDTLNELGISKIDYSDIYNVSFGSVVNYFSENLKEKADEALKFFIMLTAVLLLAGMLKSLTAANSDDTFELISVMIITMLTLMKLNSIINMVLAVLSTGSKFMMSFIPIFGCLVAMSGNPSCALTYNTLALAFSEGISVFLNKFAVSIIGGFYCFSICFSSNNNINLSRFTSAFSKICTVALGLVSSVFASMLSIKGVLSASVDSVGVKGIRFIISSVIPVVGGAISDAYSSILGTINVVKGSVAVIGIIACLIINLPCVIETLLYFTALNLLSFFSESIGCVRVSQLFRAFSVGIKFLILLVIFEMFILIISTGIMMSFKSGM